MTKAAAPITGGISWPPVEATDSTAHLEQLENYQINVRFERAEEEILAQLARNKTLTPGSREYDIALDQLFRKKVGEPEH